MSSVSSHDGSEKDSHRYKSNSDGLSSRYASLRKTDLLDAMESFKARDTDTWSDAATIGDQDSIIMQAGLATHASNSTTTLDTIHNHSNDDDSSLGRILISPLGKDNSTSVSNNNSSNNNDNDNTIGTSGLLSQEREHLMLPLALETLRDLDDHNSTTTGGDDEDKQSRSNAAEFGDDGTRSASADFDDSDSGDNDSDHDSTSRGDNDNEDNGNNDHERQGISSEGQDSHPSQQERSSRHHRRQRQHHDVVNDSIAAPPQPQPSFTPVAKSYVELLEENDVLQSQIHNLRITQKHQAQVIDNLRSLTDCSEKVFDKAISLCQLTSDEQRHLIKVSQVQQDGNQQQQEQEHHETPLEQQMQYDPHHHHDLINESCTGFTNPSSSLVSDAATTPTVYAHTITELLSQLSSRVHQFVEATVDMPWQLLLEQHLFTVITDAYLVALPFGTDNQQLLNTAYRDQLRRFQSTLGSSFAKWYRRQTVQSLSLNPATKEYLKHMQEQLSLQLMEMLDKHEMQKDGKPSRVDQDAWADVLRWCRNLSLEIHGGEADVIVQPITTGIDFDADIMTVVAADEQLAKYTTIPSDSEAAHSKPKDGSGGGGDDSVAAMGKVNFVISPLFIDEEDRVLLTARVLLT